MVTPGRKYEPASGYRYGFNGKEKDKDVAADDYDFGARIYDGRIARWLSLDPLQAKYPGESHYVFVSDNPVLYADKGGRDKIVTITLIGLDGRSTMLQVIDRNFFLYSGPEAVYGGGQAYYRYNAIQSFTIDLQNKTVSVSSVEREPGSFKRISAFEYSQLSDVIPGIMGIVGNLIQSPKSGDNSDKEQYGWRLYGVGHDMEWQNGLPRAKEGSDPNGIDIRTLLMTTSSLSPNLSPSELYSDIVNKWMKYTGKDMKQVLTAINLMTSQIESLTEITKIMMDINEKVKELSKNLNDPSNQTPGLDPGKSSTVDTIPWTKKRKDDCSACGGKNMDSSHINKVARDINQARRGPDQTQN